MVEEAQLPEVFLISFPKCGRTWLRLMLGRAIASHFELQHPNILPLMLELEPLAHLHPKIPRIRVTHDDKPQWKRPDQIVESKDIYKDAKVILLVREPKDVVVSSYFQKKKRRNAYLGDLSTYVREEVGSLDSLLKFYNVWAENYHIPQDFLLVRYEDIHINPRKELWKTLLFLGLSQVDNKVINEAVSFANFYNMRQLEEAGSFSARLRPINPHDQESFKTRKGKVGGFTEYLKQEDIDYINSKVKEVLSQQSINLYLY